MTGYANRTAGATAPAVFDSAAWRERHERPIYRVRLWPNRSLSRRGKRGALTLAGVGLCIPLAALVSTPAFWGLLPFAALPVSLLWLSFRRNDRDGRLVEELTLWPDEVRVERREPRGAVHRWRAAPYWVRLGLYPDGKVENYLTLKGNGREIELGAFLSPEERLHLHGEIGSALAKAR